jgi:glycosyltransferase involved in cell wall biosynthesis
VKDLGRVVLISWHPPESEAIAARRVESFLKHLPLEGWTVELITRSAGGPRFGVRTHVIRDRVHELRNRMAGSQAWWWRIVSPLMFRLLLPDEQAAWSWQAARMAARLEADVVLVSGPPFSQFLVAVIRRNRSPVVLDYRDLWTRGPYFTGRGLRGLLCQTIERRALHNARYTCTVSEPLSDDLMRGNVTQSFVVMNGVNNDEIVLNPAPAPVVGPLTLTYSGQLYGQRRDPRALFIALIEGDLGAADVLVQFYVPDPEPIQDLVDAYGLGSQVTVHGSVPRADMLEIQRRSDVLLLLLWDDPREEGVYSGKLFEYIAARRPVLMLGWEQGVAASLIRDRSLGQVSNDPSTIAEALRGWLVAKRRGKLPHLSRVAWTGLTGEDQSATLSRLLSDAKRCCENR